MIQYYVSVFAPFCSLCATEHRERERKFFLLSQASSNFRDESGEKREEEEEEDEKRVSEKLKRRQTTVFSSFPLSCLDSSIMKVGKKT